MPKVKVAYENRPKGEKIEVPNLGVFENGTTSEVDQADWDRFVTTAPGGERFADRNTLEVGTNAAKRATEQFHERRKAVEAEETQADGGEPKAKPLSDRNKDELVEMAQRAGVEGASDMKKSELVDALSQEG